MSTKLTVLVDNIPDGEIQGEWGLSIMVEHNGIKILADAGSSDLFAENAAKLGFNIVDVDYATLSHAHFDHANGMPRFFTENSEAKFYLRESAAENCYFKKLFVTKYIGMPKNVTVNYVNRIEYVSGIYKLCEGAYLVPHSTKGLEKIGKREMMYKRTNQGWRSDDFSHEQSLVLDTEKGLVIINCCSHGGAVNIINETQAAFPDKHVYALIGGFHLFRRSNKEIREIANSLKNTGIDYVCTGHCTKERAYGILKEVLGDMVDQMHVGKIMEF